MKCSTILLDGDLWLHRAVSYATTSVTFGDTDHWEVNVKTAGGWIRQQIRTLKDRLGAEKVIIALGDRTRNFRKELCPTYKAHRAGKPRPPGFQELEAKLKAHAKTVSAPTLEGDDVIGILATTEPTEGKVIVSIDKDLLQVPGWNYNPDKDELQEIDEEAGALFHLHQTLTGDRVDGYPGLPGCGPVKAAKILAGDTETAWERVVAAFEKAGLTEADALLQARLAFVLRQGYFNTKTKEITLWLPPNS